MPLEGGRVGEVRVDGIVVLLVGKLKEGEGSSALFGCRHGRG